MRRITILGTILLVALALVGIETASVSAQTHEFIASKTGKIKGKSTGTQVFKTGAGEVECTSASTAGEITELSSTTNKEVVSYTGCSGFGETVTISSVHFEFNASGSAKIEKSVTVTPEGAGCEVIIPSQTVETMGYTNNSGGKVTAAASVSKIKSKGSGGVCGGEEETTGTYSGSIQAELEGGTVEWK
jgi:hypothetical protein